MYYEEKIINGELYIRSNPYGNWIYANKPNPECPGCHGEGDNGNYEPCPICMKHYKREEDIRYKKFLVESGELI